MGGWRMGGHEQRRGSMRVEEQGGWPAVESWPRINYPPSAAVQLHQRRTSEYTNQEIAFTRSAVF